MKEKEETFEIQVRETRDLVRRMDRQIDLVERLLAKSEQSRELIEKYRIGEYELQRADYLLVCWLAEEVGETPEAMMDCLIASKSKLESNGQFRDVRAVKLGLLRFESPERLPNLETLWCDNNSLTELDLTAVPHLKSLSCYGNSLPELDLTAPPHLETLFCSGNCLTELDLTAVPNLESLWCWENNLTELDPTAVPHLTWLSCWENRLTELDLTAVPNLKMLSCGRNSLTELDLTAVPNLKMLSCSSNSLTELDIRPIKNLQILEYDKSSTRLIKRPDQNY